MNFNINWTEVTEDNDVMPMYYLCCWQCLHQGIRGSSEDKWGGISKPGQGKKSLNLK